MLERSRNLVEGFKSMLIFLLAFSAVYLAGKAFMPSGERGEGDPAALLPVTSTQQVSGVGTSFPVRMAVVNESGRYGVQYDSAASDILFDELGDLLGDGLGSAGKAFPVERADWEQALEAKGIYYDFPGTVSLSLLSTWLGEGEGDLTDQSTAVILAQEADGKVLLYYEQAQTGTYYACDTALQFKQRLDSYAPNEALFAFQQGERYSGLEPDTLILPEVPQPVAYKAASGLSVQDEEGLETILPLLSFTPQPNAIYPSAGGWNVREAEDSLRLTRAGNLYYHGAENSDRYFFNGAQLEDWITVTGEMMAKLMPAGGGARVYLDEVTDEDEGWTLTYRYCLSGADVQLGQEGWCARFTVKNDRITEYTMKVRRYEATAERAVLLPEYQAMHAMMAMDAAGRHLLVRYYDDGAGTAVPGWIAR